MNRQVLIVHAGLPKTGSSYIQTAFLNNAKELRKAGVLYPGVIRNAQAGRAEFCLDANFEINGSVLTNAMKENVGKPVTEICEVFGSLLAPLFVTGVPKVLLSDETLGVYSDLTWKVLKETCDSLGILLKVFCFFREPSTYYPSYWSQIVRKHGEKRSLLEFAENEHILVWKKLLNIVDEVQDTLCLSYEDEMERGSLLCSVAAAVGINSAVLTVNSFEEIVNPSLSLTALTAIRLVNEEYGETVGVTLDEMLSKLQPVDVALKAILPESHIQLVREKHRGELSACHSHYHVTKNILGLS
jgi:hypothetical protein